MNGWGTSGKCGSTYACMWVCVHVREKDRTEIKLGVYLPGRHLSLLHKLLSTYKLVIVFFKLT